jgi:hypothetical protein
MTSTNLHLGTTVTAAATLDAEIAAVALKLGVSEHLVRRLVDKLRQGSTKAQQVQRNVNGVDYTTSYCIHDPTFSRGVTHTRGPLAGWRSHTLEADTERGHEALPKHELDLNDEERMIARELWAAIEAKGGGRSVKGLTRR